MTLETDHQGFLKNANDWTLDWAKQTADEQSLVWEDIDESIVQALRSFYFEFDLSPAMRPLGKTH